ncbi:uncharacterized protein LOC132215223 [Myotis daubentonii]|uniref:uncharacterized protein LOC132215223 n=1 Tax=Myotis daubentonii TaxID=98922 RepID=UPI00287360D6|nr:uncharacterized protein LOC132215223 [Myotis daubentonii]
MPTPAGWNLSRNRRIPGLQPYLGLEAAMTSPNCRLRPPQSPRLAAALCRGLKGLILMPASQRLNLPAPSLQVCLAPLRTPPSTERRRWMRHPPRGSLDSPTAAAARGGAAQHPGVTVSLESWEKKSNNSELVVSEVSLPNITRAWREAFPDCIAVYTAPPSCPHSGQTNLIHPYCPGGGLDYRRGASGQLDSELRKPQADTEPAVLSAQFRDCLGPGTRSSVD